MIGPSFLSPVLAVTETEPTGPTRIDIGSVVLTVAIAAFLVLVGYLVTTSRRKRRPEETPKNLQPWLSDDELETKRLTRVLSSAVVAAAALAVVLPVYYVNESNRQDDAAEAFHELYVEEGAKWFNQFQCSACHGPDGGGGAAVFIEPRSGLTVQWTAPSINDVLYRYSEDEVRFWVEYGRRGTPMPAQGLVSGQGAMTVQEVDQVLAYLHDITVPQADAFGKVDGAVTQALARIESGATVVAREILDQQAVVDDLVSSEERLSAIKTFPEDVRAILVSDGFCTDDSAALADAPCNRSGLDSDRDGLTDITEDLLANTYAPIVDSRILVRVVQETDSGLSIEQIQDKASYPDLYGLQLDPKNPFTMTDSAGHPIADLDAVEAWVRELDTAHLNLTVTVERIDRFLPSAESGLAFLEASADRQDWVIDFDEVAAAMTDEWAATGDEAATVVDVDTARRAVGLFNAYCARCHTSGYNAGVAYEQPAGSGAWAPALRDGRARAQFPNIADHIDFIIRGSVLGESYGTNGLGRGWMPGFGQLLSEEDIRLIALFERTL